MAVTGGHNCRYTYIAYTVVTGLCFTAPAPGGINGIVKYMYARCLHTAVEDLFYYYIIHIVNMCVWFM